MMDVQVNIDDQGNLQRHPEKRSAAGERAANSTIALETNADGTASMTLTFAGTISTMTPPTLAVH